MRPSRVWFLVPLAAVLTTGTLAPPPARGEITADDFSAFVTLTSDYVFRGISQSDGHAAIQGGFDFEHELGFFVGVWASSVDSGYGPDRNMELDVYLGYGRSLGSRWSADFTVQRYTYPGDDPAFDYNYTEYAAAVYYRDLLSLGIAYSDDVLGRGREGVSYDLTARVPLARRLAMTAGLGYYDLDEVFGFGYAYWNLGLTRTLGRFTFDLGYFGADSESRRYFRDDGDGRVVLSISAGIQ